MQLVPLRVRIGLDQKNRHQYPAFNTLPESVRLGMDWSRLIDRFGGWLYDKKCGHHNDDTESPAGYWFGVIMVPSGFAEAAVDKFPDDCEPLTETELATYYETRHKHGEPDTLWDLEAMQLIAAKRQAGLPEDDDDRAALDPESDTPGRRRNKAKQFQHFKASRGLQLDVDAISRGKGIRAARRRNR